MESQRAEGLRLFVALELSVEAKRVLDGLLQGLRGAQIPGFRPVAVQGIHLTLKFLGDVPAERVEAITGSLTSVAREASPFLVELRGVGGFPNLPEPRVLWVGLEGDLALLCELYRSVEQTLASLGFPSDRRPFSPHLTVARLREGTPNDQRRRAGELLAGISWKQGTQISVEAVSLMQSILRPEGAEYRRLHREPLRGTPPLCGHDAAGIP